MYVVYMCVCICVCVFVIACACVSTCLNKYSTVQFKLNIHMWKQVYTYRLYSSKMKCILFVRVALLCTHTIKHSSQTRYVPYKQMHHKHTFR